MKVIYIVVLLLLLKIVDSTAQDSLSMSIIVLDNYNGGDYSIINYRIEINNFGSFSGSGSKRDTMIISYGSTKGGMEIGSEKFYFEKNNISSMDVEYFIKSNNTNKIGRVDSINNSLARIDINYLNRSKKFCWIAVSYRNHFGKKIDAYRLIQSCGTGYLPEYHKTKFYNTAEKININHSKGLVTVSSK